MARIAFVTVNDRCCLGAKQLSSVLKRHGHEPHIVHYGEYHHATYSDTATPYDPPSEEAFLKVLAELSPDLIGFSFRSVSFEVFRRLSGLARARFPGTPLLLGGIGATSDPETCIEFADMLCIGEGEHPLVEMMARIEAGRGRVEDMADVPNLWVRVGGEMRKNPLAPLIADLDGLPFCDYDGDNKCSVARGGTFERDGRMDNDVGAYSLITSRGRPFRCTYCHNSLVHDLYPGQKYLQRRGVDHVMAELIQAKSRFPNMESVNFYDDVFTFDYEWIREFIPLYRRHIALPFWCFAHPSRVDDRVIELLADAGCRFICLGAQSGSRRTLYDVS